MITFTGFRRKLSQAERLHISRVQHSVRSFSRYFGLTKEETELLLQAARFHDFGLEASHLLPDMPQDAADRHEQISCALLEYWISDGQISGFIAEHHQEIMTIIRAHRPKAPLPDDRRLAFLAQLFRIADLIDYRSQRDISDVLLVVQDGQMQVYIVVKRKLKTDLAPLKEELAVLEPLISNGKRIGVKVGHLQ